MPEIPLTQRGARDRWRPMVSSTAPLSREPGSQSQRPERGQGSLADAAAAQDPGPQLSSVACFTPSGVLHGVFLPRNSSPCACAHGHALCGGGVCLWAFPLFFACCSHFAVVRLNCWRSDWCGVVWWVCHVVAWTVCFAERHLVSVEPQPQPQPRTTRHCSPPSQLPNRAGFSLDAGVCTRARARARASSVSGLLVWLLGSPFPNFLPTR